MLLAKRHSLAQAFESLAQYFQSGGQLPTTFEEPTNPEGIDVTKDELTEALKENFSVLKTELKSELKEEFTQQSQPPVEDEVPKQRNLKTSLLNSSALSFKNS